MSRRQDQSSSRISGVALRVAGAKRGSIRLPRGVVTPSQVAGLRSALARAEMLKVGDRVETALHLPGIPQGSVGTVREVEPLFVAVEFEEGRIGYYSPRQLRPVPPERGPKEQPD